MLDPAHLRLAQQIRDFHRQRLHGTGIAKAELSAIDVLTPVSGRGEVDLDGLADRAIQASLSYLTYSNRR